jgi:peptidoglycan/xylan/chitin deacetylase (PgdA/CDA1 family)
MWRFALNGSMKVNLLTKFGLIFLLLSSLAHSQKRLIALTIDDLPFVGEEKNFHLNMIIDAIKAHEIPATGFVIASKVSANNWDTLKKFREAGLGLGNHTLNHLNLNKVKTEAYLHEIDAADRLLNSVMSEPKYFRYPYLAMSNGEKRSSVLNFLSSKNYQVAPVTIDSKDFVFNQLLLGVKEKDRRSFLGALKKCYLEFIWEQTLKAEDKNREIRKPDRAQILLIHANLLNAYVLPDIISLYKENGFTFVNLSEALQEFPPLTKPIAKKKDESEFAAWD